MLFCFVFFLFFFGIKNYYKQKNEYCLQSIGEMMMSVLWYYRPEQTEMERLPRRERCEIFASRHRDVVPVACIDDKAYVLTFNEYCR